jgi:hypothetical protein
MLDELLKEAEDHVTQIENFLGAKDARVSQRFITARRDVGDFA